MVGNNFWGPRGNAKVNIMKSTTDVSRIANSQVLSIETYVITYVSLGFWVFCAECITSLAALRSDTCATPHAFRRAAPPLTGCIRKSSILLILNSNRVWLKTGYNIYITWYNGIPGYTCYFVGKMMMDHGMLGCPVTVYVQKDSCLWASRHIKKWDQWWSMDTQN